MKYFGYYADASKQNQTNCSLAAVNKMHYISTRLANVDGKVEIISAASPLQGSQAAAVYDLGQGMGIRYFKVSASRNKVINAIKRTVHSARLFSWAYKNIKQGETVVLYHSLGYMNLFKVLKKLKNFSLILEVEEIYADVLDNLKLREKELQFMALADAYVFPTALLSKAVNKGRKPEIIIHGTYHAEPLIDNIEKAQIGEQRHILYAGTFDPRKGGVYAAINAVKFLPQNYHMHILGFGTKDDIDKIKQLIRSVNCESKAVVTYEGLKSGEAYVRFVQSCDVGLSTQNPDASFNDTSFPSKILSYFANGLKVVSVRIPAVETSKVGDLVFYYDEQEPRAIADAIIEACETEIIENVRDRINKLDVEFTADLQMLVDSVEQKGDK